MDASGEVKPHCKGQYFDFWKVSAARLLSTPHLDAALKVLAALLLCDPLTLPRQCMDKCTAPKLFAALK
jgi:hypothetical protein